MNTLLHTQQKMGSAKKGRESAQAGNTPRLPHDGCGINFRQPLTTTTTKPQGDPKVGIRGLGATF